MRKRDGSLTIFLYNLYMVIFIPSVIFLWCFWYLETNGLESFTGHRGRGIPTTALLILFPEILLGLEWDKNSTSGERIFTILCSLITGFAINRSFHWKFMVKTYAPITYRAGNILLILGIIWTIVIEFNQTLRDHILSFPQKQWVIPNSDDTTHNVYWHILWHLFLWSSVAFWLLIDFNIIP